MTAANLAVFVGCAGSLHVDSLTVAVTILDARRVWNRTDYLVTPVRGSGQQWVSAERVTDLTASTAALRRAQ